MDTKRDGTKYDGKLTPVVYWTDGPLTKLSEAASEMSGALTITGEAIMDAWQSLKFGSGIDENKQPKT